MNCAECGIAAVMVGDSPLASLYRCPRRHLTRIAKAPPPPEPDWAELARRATPPDTSQGRPSYARPVTFGPNSLAAKVLQYMRKAPRRSIDHHTAERLWNHSRLAGTIHILRTNGYLIETHENESGSEVARYELLDPERKEAP